MMYNRLNPLHWVVALFSNSRKSTYLVDGTKHVDDSQYKATQRLWYWARNPAHDFMHYIVGFVDEPDYIKVYDRMHGSFRVMLHKFRWLRLPYIGFANSYIHFYAGWREYGGFGLKLRKAPND